MLGFEWSMFEQKFFNRLKSELRVEAKFGEKFRVQLWKGGNRGCDDG